VKGDKKHGQRLIFEPAEVSDCDRRKAAIATWALNIIDGLYEAI
jgi:hypothetical protein